MRKKFWVICVGVMLMISAIGLVACGKANEETGNPRDDSMHTVTVVGFDSSMIIRVKHGDSITPKMLRDEYYQDKEPIFGGSDFDCFFTDKECLTRYVGESVTEDITLYIQWYSLGLANVPIYFVYRGEDYVIHRSKEKKLTAEDFSRSAYGHGTPEDYLFYADEEMTITFPIEGYELSEKDWYSLTIYVCDKN